MRRFPLVLAAMLVAVWLLLNNTLALEHIILGVVLSVLLVLASSRLRPVHPRLRRLYMAAPFMLTVLLDIVRSNIAVARIVLGLVRDREVRSGFIRVPMDLRDPHGLSVLAAVITATPGTAWAGLSPDGRVLKVHILDLKDEQEWIRLIKERYEQPLRRIFE